MTRFIVGYFQHPLGELWSLSSGNRDTHDKKVLMWYFEAQLKKKFSEFVAVLEVTIHMLSYVC